MGFSNLSADLIRLVLRYVSTPPTTEFLEYDDRVYQRFNLHALSLTSKALNTEATRLLYASMPHGYTAIQSAFLQTLEENPRLAVLVQRYNTPHDAAPENVDLFRRVKRVLPLMVNLKELTVRRQSDLVDIFPSPSNGVMPFQLDACSYTASKPSASARDKALAFLTTQQELKYLEWVPNTRVTNKHSSLISRKLVHLDASVSTIHSLLCGRPSIKELSWDTSDLFSRSYITANQNRMTWIFGLSEFRSLNRLFLVGDSGHALLEHLRKLNIGPFPNLRVLSDFSIQSSETEKTISNLKLFPNLEVLVVPYHSHSRTNSEQSRDKLKQILDTHPNIKYAYQYSCAGDRLREFRRWERGGSEAFDPARDTKCFALTTGNWLNPYLFPTANWIA